MAKPARDGYSPAMFAHRRWIVVLALLAFVVARLAGTHVHLCFDGSEPPLSMHTADGGELGHHAAEAQTHDDVEFDPVDDVLAKSAKADLPVLAFLLAGVLLLRMPSRASPRTPHRIPTPWSPPRYLRPLLRAPPR